VWVCDRPRRHWFNRRYRTLRRDIYLRHDAFGWVRARRGGAEGVEVTHPFTDESALRAMVDRLKAATPPEESDWAQMSTRPSS
jgi:hypothetical protein